MYDTTQSTITSGTSCDQANTTPDASDVEIAQADRRQSAEVPIPTKESQSELPSPDGVETLQERFQLMEQQLIGW